MPITIKVERLPGAEGPLPTQATPGSAGYDLFANERVEILPGAFDKVGTGIKIAIPPGYEAQVRPRSGLAAKHGITILNAPGTIDSDYRGEVCVILINHGKSSFIIEPGMRIAQFVFSQVVTVGFECVKAGVGALEASSRGQGGFGSTGF